MSIIINVYDTPDSDVPDWWQSAKITPGDPEPPFGSVVLILHEGRHEPALSTFMGWVTPTTLLPEDWSTWWQDGSEIYLVHEGDSE